MKTIEVSASGTVRFAGAEYRAALGKSGVSSAKREGDGTTPVGCFAVREVRYRLDRIEKPETILPIQALDEADGWCDDPADSRYNQLVKLPYAGRHEELWREDHVYDVIVILGYNDNPPIPGRGSAIFMHLARPGYTPTDGCIALALPDMLRLLRDVDADTTVCVAR